MAEEAAYLFRFDPTWVAVTIAQRAAIVKLKSESQKLNEDGKLNARAVVDLCADCMEEMLSRVPKEQLVKYVAAMSTIHLISTSAKQVEAQHEQEHKDGPVSFTA